MSFETIEIKMAAVYLQKGLPVFTVNNMFINLFSYKDYHHVS